MSTPFDATGATRGPGTVSVEVLMVFPYVFTVFFPPVTWPMSPISRSSLS